MIKKTEPGKLVFITNEDQQDPEFIVTLTLKNDLEELTNSSKFLKAIDAKLSHIYTVLDLFLNNEVDALSRIDRAQQSVYDATFAELLAQTNPEKN